MTIKTNWYWKQDHFIHSYHCPYMSIFVYNKIWLIHNKDYMIFKDRPICISDADHDYISYKIMCHDHIEYKTDHNDDNEKNDNK